MKGGIALHIEEGKYKGKKAIAYRAKQKDEFVERKKLAITVYSDEQYQQKIAENVLIDMWKCKQIGFVD